MPRLTPPPTTSLGRTVQAEHDAARTQKKQRSKVRRMLRMLGIAIAAGYFVMGFGSGSAQALPDPVGDAVEKVTHFCGPMDVPPPSTHEGIDTALGLNDVDDSKMRGTVRTSVDEDLAGTSGNGLERLHKAYSADDEKIIRTPTYERYGYNSLRWTNYGSSCFSPSYWFSPITNFALSMFVKFPMILGMGLLNFALDPDNVLYQAFALILTPFVKAFTAILVPWVYMIAPLGVLWVWLKSKGSTQATLQAAVWVLAIFGTFMWMGNNTSRIVTAANNVVTEFTGAAACNLMQAGEEATDPDAIADCSDDTGLSQINQALWHGVSYQTWLVGEMGERQAQASAAAEADGKIGWGPAVLNTLYVNPSDDGGKAELEAIEFWNSADYVSSSDADSKAGWWSGGDGNLPEKFDEDAAWERSTFLATVKFMCGDVATDDGGNDAEDGDAEGQRWMYKNQCDSSGAGTADFVTYFKGQEYAHQMVVAFAGGWATLAVVLAIGLAAVYLMLQKMLFFFLLAFGPLFLAIGMFADEKRRQFATRYFEILAANIMKQCVAVVVVLFVSYSMSALLNPPAGSGFPNIPWLAKPIFAMLFFIALVLFLQPMKSLAKAVAKGDVSVVDKVANAPADYAKKTAQGAAIAAAVVATGGAAAAAGAGGAAGAASSLGKTGMAMRQAGSVLGRRGGVGKMLSTAGKMQTLSAGMLNNKAAKASEKEANRQGALMLARANPGKFQTDVNGQLTPQGMTAATAEFKKTSAEGARHKQSQQAAQQQMQNFFAGHLAQTGEHHLADPKHPDNKGANNRNGERGADMGAPPQREEAPPPGPGIDIPETPYHEAEPNYQPHQYFVDVARSRVDQPTWGRDDVSIASITPAATVLASSGLSKEALIANPLTLVSGETQAYNAGDVTTMDPAHPLTPVMHHLKQVMATGSEENHAEAQGLLEAASEILASRGLPDQVAGFRAASTSAFAPAETIGAMPDLNDDRCGWRDRAEAAFTVQCAATALPAGHPVADDVDAYSRALSDPAVDLSVVQGLRDEVIQALDRAGEWHPPASAPTDPAASVPTTSSTEASGDDEFRPKHRGRSGMYDYDDNPDGEQQAHEDEDEDDDDGC